MEILNNYELEFILEMSKEKQSIQYVFTQICNNHNDLSQSIKIPEDTHNEHILALTDSEYENYLYYLHEIIILLHTL